jgi:hypothetical protein
LTFIETPWAGILEDHSPRSDTEKHGEKRRGEEERRRGRTGWDKLRDGRGVCRWGGTSKRVVDCIVFVLPNSVTP